MGLSQIGIIFQIVGILIGVILGTALLAPEVIGAGAATKVEGKFLSIGRKMGKIVSDETLPLEQLMPRIAAIATVLLYFTTSKTIPLKARIWTGLKLYPLFLFLVVSLLLERVWKFITTLMARKGMPRIATILGGALLIIVGLIIELLAS